MSSKSITSPASKRIARQSIRDSGGYLAASRNGERRNGMVYVGSATTPPPPPNKPPKRS